MSDKQDIVEQLRSWSEQLKSLSRWTSGKLKFPQRITLIGEAADEIERLRKERNEARQMYCRAIPENCDEHEARKIAWERGWDCFREDKPCQ